MAAVNITEVKPATDSVNPAILFECDLQLETRPSVLLECKASLWCNEQRIGTASVEYEKQVSDFHKRTLYTIARKGGLIRPTFHVPLTRHALRFLEEYRDARPGGDVVLELRLCVRILRLDVDARSELIFVLDGEPRRGETHEPDHERKRHMVTARSENLGEVVTEQRALRYAIPSSQWVQRFTPILGMGNFLLFEYRVPSEISNGKKSAFQEKLQRASTSLNNMQQYIQKGEWNQAAQEIRHVTELIRDEEETIAELLEKDAIERSAAEHITKGMHEMFGYASKFVHSLDQSGEIMPRQKASKEDAYLAYTMGTAVVNLLTAKLKRSENRSTS